MSNPEEEIKREEYHYNLSGGRGWVAFILAILLATSGYLLFRVSSEQQQRAELLRTNQALQSSLDQAKSDLHAAANRFNTAETRSQSAQLSAPAVLSEPVTENAPATQPSAGPTHKLKKANGNHIATTSRAVKDPRWSQMDAKLADQQLQLEGTKSDIAKTREDLQGQLGSTRDELNGSIAKTHDEIAELRKRGERNYYEFELKKSPEFARTGPVSLSLRKANVKRKYFDIALIVDDQRIEKKHVNLYEPLWISVPGHAEPVQVVVNAITKDNVKGYLSESRYKKSELASGESARTTMPDPNSGPAAADKELGRSIEEQ